MITAKEILLDELTEQGHPEQVEDVIFWALESYAKSEPKGTWGRVVAYAIKERIVEAEKGALENEPIPTPWDVIKKRELEIKQLKEQLALLRISKRSICDKYTNHQCRSNLTCTTCGASKLDHES